MTSSETPTAGVASPSHSPAREKLTPGSALVITLLIVSTFTVLLNEMLLGVALPTLITDLGITPSTGQWLTTGYLLTLAVLIPATGFLMQRFHLRTIFLSALTLFTAGTAVAAIAPGFGVLFAGRIIQAAGSAVFLPLLMTTTMRLVPAGRRGQIMAIVTAVPAAAPAVGPALSGLILSALSWRWLFILMLPIALIALALGAWKLRNITTPEPVTLDVASLALSVIGFGGLVYGLASIGESVSDHAPVAPYIPIAIGLAGLAAFVLRQVRMQRRGAAFLDVRIFRIKPFTVPLLVSVVVALVAFGSQIVLPLVLTDVTGLSTLSLGLFLVPGGAVLMTVASLGGRVYDRFGPRPLTVPGAVIWTAALWFLSTVDENTGVPAILAAYLVLNAGQAMVWPTMTTAALASLRAELYPHGTAALNTIQQLAGAAGGAVLISAYTIGSTAADAGAMSTSESVSAGHAAFITAGAIALAAVLGSLFVRRTPAATEPAEPAPDNSTASSDTSPRSTAAAK
ncbi:DHA2 family efflux MFS transporter permease subunit [Streptomyces pseudogriseolus]|uniref:DHA2 family efflux MFS transporter permease subunit n=1 Tax=Streptomyces pseudogriseolus TaxID=36817 RepID=UPI00346E21DC